MLQKKININPTLFLRKITLIEGFSAFLPTKPTHQPSTHFFNDTDYYIIHNPENECKQKQEMNPEEILIDKKL